MKRKVLAFLMTMICTVALVGCGGGGGGSSSTGGGSTVPDGLAMIMFRFTAPDSGMFSSPSGEQLDGVKVFWTDGAGKKQETTVSDFVGCVALQTQVTGTLSVDYVTYKGVQYPINNKLAFSTVDLTQHRCSSWEIVIDAAAKKATVHSIKG